MENTDWDEIYKRLASAVAPILQSFQHKPEEIHRVLEARARLAAKPPPKTDDSEHMEVLAFSLAGETYGLQSFYIQVVCQLRDLTAIPCTPPFIAGVMNLHGRILAVVDLRKFFDLPIKGLTELNRVIVLKDGENEFGLLADSIEGLCMIARSDLQESFPTLTGIRERFLKGVTNRMLVVLDGARLLCDTGLKVDEQITG